MIDSNKPRRRRNKILIWIIGLGLLNFLSYTVTYALIGGDAVNGKIEDLRYFVRGHFLHHGPQGQTAEVSAPVWVYSFIHSISIWPTIGVVLCSMLFLARPHILATMREDSLIRGPSFFSAAMTIILIVTGASMLYFVVGFCQALGAMRSGGVYGL